MRCSAHFGISSLPGRWSEGGRKLVDGWKEHGDDGDEVDDDHEGDDDGEEEEEEEEQDDKEDGVVGEERDYNAIVSTCGRGRGKVAIVGGGGCS